MIQTTNCIAILHNPKAGRKHISRFIKYMLKTLSGNGLKYQLFSLHWPESLDDFTEVWVIGGDGTINYFINHYPDCSIPIVLFKGGTGNDFAVHLYGDLSNKQILHHVLKATPKRVDAGMFNDQLYLNSLGMGFDGEVLRNMNAIRFIGGHLGYYVSVLKNVLFFKEKEISIITGRSHKKEKFLLVMVNNTSSTGGGFRIAPLAKIDDGKLDMVVAKKLSVLKRLRYLPILEKGKHLHLPFVMYEQQQEIKIETTQPLALQVDGELYFTNEVEIKILPKKFLFKY